MGRFLFTIQQSIKQQKKIKAVRQKKHKLISVTDLNIKDLTKHNIHYLALDFDGVLTPHGQFLPDRNITNWLQQFSNEFGQNRIFILSNKPTDIRKQYFQEHFPDIRFISNVRKKPYPDGLLSIQKQLHCHPQEVALIDDRLLTGGLACILAGSFPILITSPLTDYKKRPFQEAFFGLLRAIEKGVFLI